MRIAHTASDLAAIDTASEKLNAAWQAASQEIYAAAGGNEAANAGETQANPGAGSQGNPADDSEVTDVNFEEVK